MKAEKKIKTGFIDKVLNEIKIGDFLVFDNGSKYKVIIKEDKVILESCYNLDMPLLLLEKITYGRILCSAMVKNNKH
jgi:hypothetical protein